MSVVFKQGQEIGRGDLDLFLSNPAGNAQNAFSITYAIYFVDPGSNEEVLIGPSNRVPVNPAVGEYYASLAVPGAATPGNYRVRWTFQENVTTPQQQVVQEFGVVSENTTTEGSHFTNCETEMIRKFRIMLRDNCVGGEEIVELDVAGEIVQITMVELWCALNAEVFDV